MAYCIKGCFSSIAVGLAFHFSRTVRATVFRRLLYTYIARSIFSDSFVYYYICDKIYQKQLVVIHEHF